jgi:hypothetical protein
MRHKFDRYLDEASRLQFIQHLQIILSGKMCIDQMGEMRAYTKQINAAINPLPLTTPRYAH